MAWSDHGQDGQCHHGDDVHRADERRPVMIVDGCCDEDDHQADRGEQDLAVDQGCQHDIAGDRRADHGDAENGQDQDGAKKDVIEMAPGLAAHDGLTDPPAVVRMDRDISDQALFATILVHLDLDGGRVDVDMA